MNRTDLQQLADVRIAEAGALLQLPVPMPDGAYYLAGYAVECALKACIAKLVYQHDFPDKQLALESYTHDIEELVRVAKLKVLRSADKAVNRIRDQHWDVVKDWNQNSRYVRHSMHDAQKLYAAITDPLNGVLPWIKVHW